MLNVEIDPGSGFCGGVIRAITRAEDFLSREGRLYSLGAIVHNDAELGRLQQQGLVTVGSLEEVPEGGTVLIRAHQRVHVLRLCKTHRDGQDRNQ